MEYVMNLNPIVTEMQATITSLLPVGITIFATLTGVKLIPKIIKSFM